MEYVSANSHESTKEFMQELLALFEKHKLCVFPMYEGSVSLHDVSCVDTYDGNARDFYKKCLYLPLPMRPGTVVEVIPSPKIPDFLQSKRGTVVRIDRDWRYVALSGIEFSRCFRVSELKEVTNG